MNIRISGIVRESVVDGPGIRYAIFTQGCTHNCRGCHNPETHDPNGGYEMDIDEILDDIKSTGLISGITLSGGDPFLQSESSAYIAERVKSFGLNVVTYTGYTFEELKASDDASVGKLLESTDILVDGRFVISEKDISLKFRGSRNQRVIDIKSSLESGYPVTLYK